VSTGWEKVDGGGAFALAAWAAAGPAMAPADGAFSPGIRFETADGRWFEVWLADHLPALQEKLK
jgi:hypothetical protein